MANKNGFEKKLSERLVLNVLFLIILFIFFVTTIFSYIQSNKVKTAYEWARHSHKVMQTANQLLFNVMDAESITRGYMISGDPIIIFDFDDKINNIMDTFQKAQSLVQDNPIQVEVLKKLKPLLEKRIEVLKQSSSLKKTNQLSQANALNIIHEAQALDRDIKAMIHEFYEDEVLLLKSREESFLDQFNINNFIFGAINILNILFLLFIIIFFNRIINRYLIASSQAERNRAVMKGIIGGSKEYIAAVDQDFNFLTFNDAFATEFRNNFGKHAVVGENLKEALSNNKEQQEKGVELWQRALNGEEFTVIADFGPMDALKKYEITFNAIYGDNNKIIGAAQIARDVSELMKREMELKNKNNEIEESYKKIEEKAHEMSIINDMNNVFRTSASLEDTLTMINLYIKKLIPESTGIIYLMKQSKNYLELALEWGGLDVNSEKIFAPEECWSLRQGKMYIYIDESDSMPCKHVIMEKEIPPYICIPLLALNEVIGVMHIRIPGLKNDKDKFNQFIEEKQILLQNVSGQIALSISNIKLQEFLKVRSTRDVLTNLYNRSYLNETFDRDLQRALRNQTSIAVIMMDLDHFKKVNDTYGHDAGDIVLREISKTITAQLRKSDIACRYGGEEILIVLYDADKNFAVEKIEFLRQSISDLEFKFVNLINITASFGIAMFPADGRTSEDLIRAADQALYQSKMNGRNQVTVYTKPKEV